MDHQRISQQALYWEVPCFKRGPGRTRTNWRGVIKKDLQRMGLTWEEAEVAAVNRQEWRRNVAQCVHLDMGWIKYQVSRIDVSHKCGASLLKMQSAYYVMLTRQQCCWAKSILWLTDNLSHACFCFVSAFFVSHVRSVETNPKQKKLFCSGFVLRCFVSVVRAA